MSTTREARRKNTGLMPGEAIHPTSEYEEKAEESNISVF